VRFHLESEIESFDGKAVTLAGGERIDTDFVVVGIGVKPRAELAEAAGIDIDNGVLVDAFLETSMAGVFAAGDIASYPDPLTSARLRIEHWVTAERQGQVAAANMIGLRRRFEAVPFFWTEQHGRQLRYVGHAAPFDEVEIDGDVEAGEFVARYFRAGVHLASAGLGRDLAILEDERRLERQVREARGGDAEPFTPAAIESTT
jgi:3-phenylpropionate/trans-cinnamate dioxygenase ferredoxin reductase subunit